jgi:hypothetical protein
LLTPLIALGADVTDDSSASNSVSPNNNASVFGSGEDFDLSATAVVIGDTNGSDNTVTLTGTSATRHVIGELRDESGNPAGGYAEGNAVTLSGGTYDDVAGGLATG